MEFSSEEHCTQPFPSPGDLPNPGIEPALQVDSLPAEPPGKPKNTGVGSLALLLADLPYPGIKPGSPALQADSLPTSVGRQILFCFFGCAGSSLLSAGFL